MASSHLSLATKLLWLKYRDPFIIYDSVVRQHLGTPRGDYAAYLRAWDGCYAIHRGAILCACQMLAQQSLADLSASTHPQGAVQKILTEEWFRRRVLDLLIWHDGA